MTPASDLNVLPENLLRPHGQKIYTVSVLFKS